MNGGKGKGKFGKFMSMAKGASETGMSAYSSASEMAGEMGANFEGMDSVIENITEMKEMLQTTVSEGEAVRNVLETATEEIAAMRQALESSSEEMVAVKEEVASVKDEVVSVKDEVASVKEEVASAKSKTIAAVNEIKELLASMQALLTGEEE